MIIHNNRQLQLNFKGYDAIPLNGLYMQGLQPNQKGIYDEMSAVAKKESLNLYLNQDNTNFSKQWNNNPEKTELPLSLWGQDRKAFITQGKNQVILWDNYETVMYPEELGELGNFDIKPSTFFPRGGNYFLGYNSEGQKWMLIAQNTIAQDNSDFTDPSLNDYIKLARIFDLKKESIFVLDTEERDLDEFIRPIGYPYVLVNSPNENLKNIEKMKEKFHDSKEIYNKLMAFAMSEQAKAEVCNNLCKKLKEYGFIPIEIGGRYAPDINFINAIAFKNKNNKVTYITNSTKDSYPELEYLEQLFEQDLRDKTANIENVYFISGGKYEISGEKKHNKQTCNYPPTGFINSHNAMMYCLGAKQGGIHCLTAEIPNFDIIA